MAESRANRAEPPRRAASAFESLYLGPHERLIVRAGIHLDPGGVGIAVRAGGGIGREAGADLAVADDAGRERRAQVEQVAGEPALQHVGRVGEGGAVGLHRVERGLIQPPVRAIGAVQVHLDLDEGLEAVRRRADFGQRVRLVGGKPVGAGELDQEQVVLHQIVAERGLGQCAVAQALHEGMLDIASPVVRGGLAERRE